MTFGELKDALSELPEEQLNRDAIASWSDGRYTFTDFTIKGIRLSRINRANFYKEFANIELEKKCSFEDFEEIPRKNA